MIQRTKPFARTLKALNALLLGLILTCAASSAQAAGFASPSGNIRCYVDIYSAAPMDEVGLVCLVFSADWDLPPDYGDDDPTCDLDRTRTILLPRDGVGSARWTCHGDVFWPAPLGAISYGSEWSLFGFECDMATDGVRCTNPQGDGFHVRRADVTFN